MKLNGRNFRIPRRMIVRLIVVAIAGAVAWFGKNNDNTDKKAPSAHHSPNQQEGEFQVYSNCKLVPSKYNDGDSFTVSHNGTQQEYRLYYVDSPESKDKPYEDHKKRVREQGQYLGGLNYNEALKVGVKAKNFTKKILSKPFRIYTTGELVFQGPRQHAFVQVTHNGEQRWLHELLVEEGLVRIHTRGAPTPEGLGWKQQKAALKKLEQQAKSQNTGAWKN